MTTEQTEQTEQTTVAAPLQPGIQTLSFEVQYFKPSGKYYTEGHFELEVNVTEEGSVYMQPAFDHVKLLQRIGRLPGLVVGGGKTFTIHVSHLEGYPCLIPALHVEAET